MKFPQRNTRAAKLTPERVASIRQRYATGQCSQGQLARDEGVSVNQIGRIVRGEVWQDVLVPPSAEELAESAQRLKAAIEGDEALEARLAADIAAAKDEASGASVDRMMEELEAGGEEERRAAERLKRL